MGYQIHANKTHRYSGGKLQIENDVGHDECDGAMLLCETCTLLPVKALSGKDTEYSCTSFAARQYVRIGSLPRSSL